MLPFTRAEFFASISAYNAAVWPAQIAGYALGAAAVVLAWRGGKQAGRGVALILAAMWLGAGIGYHLVFFTRINDAAWLFGVAFVLQGGLFLLMALRRHGLAFGPMPGWQRSALGGFLVAYALAYPLLVRLSGHPWPEVPSFGLTPCPVTILTFGLLLLERRPVPAWLLVVPTLWAVIGGSAAVLLAVPPDWMLLLGGLAASAMLLRRQAA